MNSILNLSAVRMVDLDASNLERYGLAQPKYQLELVTLTGKEVLIRIGDSAGNGQYYVTSTALPAIMTVQADALTAVDLPLTDYVDRFVALMSIWKVSSVSLDLEGEQHELGLSVEEGQKITDETVELTLDGQDAKIISQSGENLFSTFYQTLIGIRIDGFDLAASPDGPVTSRITYTLKPDPASQSDAKALVIEFVSRDAYTDYVLIDGSYTGFYVSHRDTFTSGQVARKAFWLLSRSCSMPSTMPWTACSTPARVPGHFMTPPRAYQSHRSKASLVILILLAFLLLAAAVALALSIPEQTVLPDATESVDLAAAAQLGFTCDATEAQRLYPFGQGIVKLTHNRLAYLALDGSEVFAPRNRHGVSFCGCWHQPVAGC
ncbi:MAG: DUF4340 domain-containing protein [Clostridiales bacterium]|nr:DUF4340 domain-containing protein [Clostridiales bacterium]